MFWLLSAQNVNYLNISPSTWTYKYFCDFNVSVNADYNGWDYSNCIYHISFDTGVIGLSYLSRWASFDTHDLNEYLNTNLNVLHVEEQNAAGLLTGSATCSTLKINNKNTNVASTLLEFVDNGFNTPTANTFVESNEGLVLNGVWNTLTWVYNAEYDFDAAPCVNDTDSPIVFDNSWGPSAISGWQLLGLQNINMLVVDWTNSNSHYRFSWSAITLNNYEEVVTADHVDNQYGVDSSTLSVKISNAANGWTIENITPISTVYTWTYTPNKFTWNSENRWYWIDFTNFNSFEIEKEVVLTITGEDNANYNGQTNPMTKVFTFNTPNRPTMTMTLDWLTFQSPTVSPLIFQANDTWAWVDTGSVKIEIPAIYSWAVLLMSGYVYSGSELNFSLNHWLTWAGNSGWYEISLFPKRDFPPATGIVVSWFVADLATNAVNLTSNRQNYNWGFETRPDCQFYWCNEMLDIYIMWWSHSAWSPYQFTGELLVVTWTNPDSPYPYLTWIDNNILMCWLAYTGTNVEPIFDMYDVDWVTLLSNVLYTWDELYIVGLDFTYSDGVITVVE